MSGHTKWADIKHKPSEAKLAAARAELDRELTLAELRRARELTQTQLAQALDTSQSGVSQIEKRTDLYVSTMRSYVEALGGRLELTAVFPDGVVGITTFEQLEEPAEPVPA